MTYNILCKNVLIKSFDVMREDRKEDKANSKYIDK